MLIPYSALSVSFPVVPIFSRWERDLTYPIITQGIFVVKCNSQFLYCTRATLQYYHNIQSLSTPNFIFSAGFFSSLLFFQGSKIYRQFFDSPIRKRNLNLLIVVSYVTLNDDPFSELGVEYRIAYLELRTRGM